MANSAKEPPKTIGDHPTYAQPFFEQDNDRGVFLGSAMNDNLFTAILTLSAEVWAVRRRQMIWETLMAKNNAPVTPEMVEKYHPTEKEQVEWKAQRDDFVKLLFNAFIRRKDLDYAKAMTVDSFRID